MTAAEPVPPAPAASGTPPPLRPEDLGVPEVVSSSLPGEHARRVAATLDQAVTIEPGTALPRLWHWAFFTPEAPTAALGADGHPQLPADGPMAALPRRMWAGGAVRWLRPLRTDQPAERRTGVASVQEKAGRSGRLLLVTLHHEYLQDGGVCIEEEQDLVYREPPAPNPAGAAAGAVAPPPSAAPAPTAALVVHREVREVTLLRYSALTFNAHRIHYDLPYARTVEGYPGLVVHGPLLATLMTQAAGAHAAGAGRELVSIRYRAVAPAIAPDTLAITVDDDAGPAAGDPAGGPAGGPNRTQATAALVGGAQRSDGTLAMQATFALAPASTTSEER